MIVTIDLETLYSSEYSLSKMSEVDYIRSPLFQVIMCAVKINNDPAEMYIGYDQVAKRLHQIDWSRAALLSHNIRFDGAIAAWHFGIKPKLYLCTLSMARALIHIAAGGSSLAKVSKYLGLPDKGDEVVRAIGKRLQDFTRVELRAYADYCLRDAENCKAAFDLFRPRFATSELAVVDQFARMFIEPEVMLDRAVLSEHLAALQAAREALFASAAHIERPVFSSNVKFAALLESMGVEVPTKRSPTTGHEIPALSRSDRGFKELVDDATQPPAVQAVLAVRIGAKSTAEETRTQTLLNLSRHSWAGPGGNLQGLCPVPLKYWGAHTGRASGDGGFNFLNLQRGSPLRRAIRALPGMRIVHRDSSQIEARMVAWMARCSDLLEAFAQGRDVYSEFASKIYRRRITKADKLERFVGKTCLAAGTRILTDRGIVDIETVTKSDKLWDGIQWVDHDGLIAYGQKETLTLSGVSLTPDHLVWCGTEWQETQSLVRDRSGRSLRSALSAASLPSPATYSASGDMCKPSSCNAPVVGLNTPSTETTLRLSKAPGVTTAPSSQRQVSDTGNTLTPCPTTHIEPDCSIASQLQSPDATPPPHGYTTATVRAGSSSARSGATIAPRSCGISNPAPGGTTPASTWTDATTTRAMNPATSGSPPQPPTCSISDGSTTLRPASASLKPVYDLANAGPRNRFTVITDDGPLIVANSILGLGYGCGPARFRAMLFIGNGGVSVTMDERDATSTVYLYRREYDEIPGLWNVAGEMLQRMIYAARPVRPDEDFDFRRVTTSHAAGLPSQLRAVDWTAEALWLPSGMAVQYPNLRTERVNHPDGRITIEQFYDGGPGRGAVRIYGAKVIENLCQALARIVITDIGSRVYHATGYKPFLNTYDSLDFAVPEGAAAAMDRLLEAEFAIPPGWAYDLPLASEGGWGFTLADAERGVNQ